MYDSAAPKRSCVHCVAGCEPKPRRNHCALHQLLKLPPDACQHGQVPSRPSESFSALGILSKRPLTHSCPCPQALLKLSGQQALNGFPVQSDNCVHCQLTICFSLLCCF